MIVLGSASREGQKILLGFMPALGQTGKVTVIFLLLLLYETPSH
jgi:hypothetical protein